MIFSLRFVAIGAALLLAVLLPVRADDDDDAHTNQALAVAKDWVAEIDAGDYDKSYTEGGDALHQKVPQDTWSRILKTERPLLGSVVTRTRIDQSYRPNGFEGADGEFFLVSYRTEFTNKQDEIEHVVLRREGGHWRGVGYDFGPEQVETDPYEGPTTTSTTSTNTPPTPTNGITVPAKRPGN
jgi:hypothetical protein